MFRRVIAAVLMFAIATTGLAACTQVIPKDPYAGPSAPEGWTPLPAKGDPVPSPAPIDNSIIPFSDPIDTSEFTQPVSVLDWRYEDANPPYVVISLLVAYDDWPELAEQVGVTEIADPNWIQINGAAARSLVDLDQMAADINRTRAAVGDEPIDFSTIETHYALVFGP